MAEGRPDEPPSGGSDDYRSQPLGPNASRLTIPSRLGAIDDARRWAAALSATHDLPDSWVVELELALTEALSNVMRHAYRGEEDQEVQLMMEIDDRGVRVDIRDFGLAFDFESLAPVNLDDPRDGGYGVFMIESLVDAVSREPGKPRGNWLRLTKLRPAER